MATTTNYGWTTPDDTALVKDGASAIRTLGSSVDTTTKNLNPSTTLGDIEYRSSTANTNTRLGIGTTGQVLSVSGGVPSWATPTSSNLTLSQVATGTLSGTSTVISGLTQDFIQIQVSGISISADTLVRVRLNSNDTSNYSYVMNGAAQYNYVASPIDVILLNTADSTHKASNTSNSFVLTLTNAKATGFTTFQCLGQYTNASSVATFAQSSGIFAVAAQITSVQFYLSTGTYSAGAYKVLAG